MLGKQLNQNCLSLTVFSDKSCVAHSNKLMRPPFTFLARACVLFGNVIKCCTLGGNVILWLRDNCIPDTTTYKSFYVEHDNNM